VPHLDLHPVQYPSASLSGLLGRDAFLRPRWKYGTSVMCQKARRDRAWLLCLPLRLRASPHSEVPLTRDGDLCDADELLCWLVDGGLLLLASGKRVASLTKTCTAPSFYYSIVIRSEKTISFSVVRFALLIGLPLSGQISFNIIFLS